MTSRVLFLTSRGGKHIEGRLRGERDEHAHFRPQLLFNNWRHNKTVNISLWFYVSSGDTELYFGVLRFGEMINVHTSKKPVISYKVSGSGKKSVSVGFWSLEKKCLSIYFTCAYSSYKFGVVTARSNVLPEVPWHPYMMPLYEASLRLFCHSRSTI